LTDYVKNIVYPHQSNVSFRKDLLKQIHEYFEKNKITTKANGFMWFKVVFLLTTYIGLWTAMAFKEHSLVVTFGISFLFLCNTLFLAFTVAHDAVHSTLSDKKWVNDWIYWFSFNLLGPNAYLWKIRHNNAHHIFVNIPGSDVDIESTELLRIAPHTPWKKFHRFQHFYIPFLYSIFTLHWIFFKDFKLYFTKTFGNVTNLKHHPMRFIELLGMKLFYVFYMLVIPCTFLSYTNSQIIMYFIGFHLVMSFLLLVIFASSHVNLKSHFVHYDEEGKMPHSFYEHQLLTSIDFHPTSSVFSFFFGGFNSHVAHHMFPQICSVHYAELTKIIKKVAAKHDLQYYEFNLLKLWVDHFRFLKQMGQSPDAGNKYLIPRNSIDDSFQVPLKTVENHQTTANL
jgi:linoleoyl-CoA desaturase